MANVSPINIDALDFASAGTLVGAHLDAASVAPMHAVPPPMAASPVDVAATGAATAMQTKMSAMQGELAEKGPEMQAKAAASAGALQAQDVQNASPLKDLASAIPSSGGSSGGGSGGSSGGSSGGNNGHVDSGNYRPGEGKVSAVDDRFRTGGGDKEPKEPHERSGRDTADSVLDITKGVGKIVGGGATAIGGILVGGAGVAGAAETGGGTAGLILAGVGLAGTGISVISDGLENIVDGMDDLSK